MFVSWIDIGDERKGDRSFCVTILIEIKEDEI